MNKFYQLTVTLLEDLHTGTGTGNTIVDAVQTRDENGYPIIDRHHFRGVMKDNAKRLCRLGVITPEQLNRLFGEEGGTQRKLDCSSLRITPKKKDKPDNYLIYWDATARKKNSRCPEDNSLRRIEYIKAGKKLSGTISLSDVSDDDIANFKTILKFTTRLGAERTRGSGQIQIDYPEATSRKRAASPLPMGTHYFRILLKAEEPLCIPTSGHAGNIIRTESHIPGRVIFAALCAKAHQTGDDTTLKQLFTEELQISNAYPIPTGYEKQNLQAIQVFPMPNHIHTIKQGNKETDSPSLWPHWAKPDNPEDSASPLLKGKDIDLYSKNTENKTNRPKGAVYLFKDQDNKYYHYQQSLTIRMRNQRGDPFGKNEKGETIKRKDTELFSEQRIPAGTYFLMDVSSSKIALLNTVASYLSVSNQLFIGRSKAPVSIQTQQIANNITTHGKAKNEQLTLIATSDWIIRGDNLGYLTTLNKQTLGEVFEINLDNIKLISAYQETETQGSFNYATRLPKRPFEVIRRGSSFQLTGNTTDIKNIYKTLTARTTPIGERTTEGYGNYIVNLNTTFGENTSNTANLEKQREASHLKEATADKPINENKQEPPKTEPIEKAKAIPQLDEITTEKVKQSCQSYWEIFKTNIQSPPPSLEDWHHLKKALLREKNNAFIPIVQKKTTCSNYFYSDQKANNLPQNLTKLVNKYTSNKEAALHLFLNELENYIYAGEQS